MSEYAPIENLVRLAIWLCRRFCSSVSCCSVESFCSSDFMSSLCCRLSCNTDCMRLSLSRTSRLSLRIFFTYTRLTTRQMGIVMNMATASSGLIVNSNMNDAVSSVAAIMVAGMTSVISVVIPATSPSSLLMRSPVWCFCRCSQSQRSRRAKTSRRILLRTLLPVTA